ncbi:CAAX amino terminal protease family protein [Asticcacaulis biprosthecium C19]|uniref:CAAX amino terminal protease family protein n=1 Tax=Asticcacaulis biprosthecium C19 TaxID=715226 RepID=F4QL82_9CAUL|nr:CPBP family intramembrane glutamic endopeptidase [Asticcacaulis biprosthecium]EGF93457.1 CAAX amino terminal protease family protein [Asticcacaulis biprosthecium C19]
MPVFATVPTFLDHARIGRHAFWRYLLAVLLALFIQAVVSVIYVVAVVVVAGVPFTELQTAIADPARPMLFFPLIGVSFAAWLVGFGLGVLWLHGKNPLRLLGNWTWAGFLLGLGIWLAVLIANTVADYALQPDGFSLRQVPIDPAVIAVIVAALAVQTFAEEYVFRGYITQALLKISSNKWIAIIVGSLLFGALHIPNGIPQAVSATVMGVAFAWITLRTGSIAFAAGVHFINNLYGAVVVVSGVDVFKGAPGLVTQVTPGLMWWDIGFTVVALGVIMLILARRVPRPA